MRPESGNLSGTPHLFDRRDPTGGRPLPRLSRTSHQPADQDHQHRGAAAGAAVVTSFTTPTRVGEVDRQAGRGCERKRPRSSRGLSSGSVTELCWCGMEQLRHASVRTFQVWRSRAHGAMTASPRGEAVVRRLGADVVFDDTRERFEELLTGYDCAFDLLGGDTQSPTATSSCIQVGPIWRNWPRSSTMGCSRLSSTAYSRSKKPGRRWPTWRAATPRARSSSR